MTNCIETVPTYWTTEDEAFFGLVARIFDPTFLYGAGVLLASYDAELSDERTSDVPAGTGVASARRDGDALVDAPSS